ncbi:hypothetical protein R3P38DRAFT_2413657, partial [Favolaschia claudopus]
ASSLIAAKGAELKFWIIKTNESAEKKVLNVSGTVETLRSSLAAYYGFDLTVNPRVETINVPTVDESIRDRQWADLVSLGIEWKDSIKAGKQFKLVPEKRQKHPGKSWGPEPNFILANAISFENCNNFRLSRSSGSKDFDSINSSRHRASWHRVWCSQSRIYCSNSLGKLHPSEPGRRGTADPSWPKYSNLVSKRERIHRVLMQDFAGDKEKFFKYFTVPPPTTKKRKRGADVSDLPTEYFRSFRKIVEAI